MNTLLPSDPRSVNPPFNAFVVNDWLVSRRCPLTPCERSILRVVMAHADWETGDGAFPSLATIAAESGCSRATVCRALNHFDELADLGYPVTLTRERRFINGQFTSNLYSIATNDNSQVRLPSLMVRQQELTSLNQIKISEESEVIERVGNAITRPPLVEQQAAPLQSSPAPEKRVTESDQAARMRELAKLREKLLHEGRLRFPTQQHAKPLELDDPRRITPTLVLDYPPASLPSADEIARDFARRYGRREVAA